MAAFFCCAASTTKPTHINANLIAPQVNLISLNWQKAGLLSLGGIPYRTTQCGSTVQPTGIIPPASGDDSSVIQTAVNSCTAGDYLLLAAGTTSSVVVSVTGNTLTLVSGTFPGLSGSQPLGDAIIGTGFYPGTTLVSGSGGTWMISLPPVTGFTISNETVTASTQFNVANDSTNDYVLVNKSITVRGSGTCTQGNTYQSVCPTIVNQYNGGIPDWVLSPFSANGSCGAISTSPGSCGQAQAPFLLSPTPTYEWGVGGCAIDNVNPTTSSCGTKLTADVAQGATQVQVTSTANFSVGQWVIIDEDPQTTSQATPTGTGNLEASSDWLSTSPTPVTMRLADADTTGGYSFVTSVANRVNQEIHLISGIGSSQCPGGTSLTICFDSPLTMAFRQSGSHDARLYWATCNGSVCNFLSEAGIENLSITRAAGNGGSVQMVLCAYCWMKNVDVGGWIKGVDIEDSARDQIDMNYLHLGYNQTNNGNEYPVAIDERSTEVLLINNIITFGGKGMVGRAAPAAVVAYNYVDKTFYESEPAIIGNYFQEMEVNGSHFAGTHHWLMEGNQGPNCDSDSTHGNAIYHTYFRNNCTGLRSNYVDPSQNFTQSDTSGTGLSGTSGTVQSQAPGLLRAAGPMGWDYWFAYVGNVLGTSAQTTSANGWVYASPGCNLGSPAGQQNKSIWCSGWMGSGSAQNDPNLNGVNSPQFLFKNHNYDYVTGGFADNAPGYSQSLPASLYIVSKPAFFFGGSCVYPFPWVTVDTAPYVLTNSCGGSGLPAKYRFDQGAPLGAQP
jgi:hypothetical protein